MELNINDLIKTKRKKKRNNIINILNLKNINILNSLYESGKVRSFEAISIEYIASKNLWNYNSLNKALITIALIKNQCKKLIKTNKPFGVDDNISINIQNLDGLKILVKSGAKSSNISIFDLNSEEVDNDLIAFLKSSVKKFINEKMAINFYDFFVLSNNKDVKILNTLKGLEYINAN